MLLFSLSVCTTPHRSGFVGRCLFRRVQVLLSLGLGLWGRLDIKSHKGGPVGPQGYALYAAL